MLELGRFARRVRLVRAWRGAAMGACAGALGAASWSALDWLGRADATPKGMALCVLGGTLVGALAGAAVRLPAKALTASVDRRAKLENRLTASSVDVAFAEEIRHDAEAHLGGVRPAEIYPFKVGRWHGGALAAMALAASIFLLGSTPLVLSAEKKAERQDLAKQGQVVERIRKEQFETPEAQKEMSESERRLEEEARKLQRDLEKGHLNREEALQKENEMERKAEDLAKQAAQESQNSLAQAETAMEKVERAELEKSGMGQIDPSLLQMPQGEKEAMKAQNAAKQNALRSQMEKIDKRLAEIAKKLAQKGLTEEQRTELEKEQKALEAKKSELQKEMEKAQKEAKDLALSKDAQATLAKMQNSELMKEIRELAKKMAKSNADAMKSGQPSMTPEQRQEMKKQMEALLAKLKDDKAMQEYLKQMMEAMRNAMKAGGQAGRDGGMGLGLMGLLGLQMGPGAPSEDTWMGNTEHINRLDKAEKGQGKTTETQVSGERQAKGDETFVEIKAPTTVGNRTSVPYRTVLPSYTKKAEEALNRNEIPKGQEKRVRAYFESLTKGK